MVSSMTATLAMSGPDFDALPYEEGRRWELLDGTLIATPSPTLKHQKIVFAIQSLLLPYLGDDAEVSWSIEFALCDNTRLRPDVCVLLPATARQVDPDRVPIPLAPDLAIEVISPTERPSESLEKVRTYLRHGVAEAWQVYPKSRTVEIHWGTGTATFGAADTLSTPLLPGFTPTVASLFD